ncbi:hypothetical protein AB7M42_006441 [Bradyrhizobium diazoefficiens]
MSAMSCARGSFGSASIDWSAVTMQAPSRKEADSRMSVPGNAERRRKSGWTTSNKIRLPTLEVIENCIRSPSVRTRNSLRHDYVFAKK